MNGNEFSALASLQRADGAFPSVIVSPDGQAVSDFNCFTAAIVLRRLRNAPPSPERDKIVGRGLDWLTACRSARPPNAFSFWPDDDRPAWATGVPADVDDTAIILCELLRHGRIGRAATLRIVCDAILPCRVKAAMLPVLPPWVAEGSFFTWIPPESSRAEPAKPFANIVDCCVNANVAALLALLGTNSFPGHDASIQTIVGGLQWAGQDPARLSSLTPFYPSLIYLAEAVDHAVECGVTKLLEALAQLRLLAAGAPDGAAGICRSAYSRTVWHAPAADVARAISSQHVLRVGSGRTEKDGFREPERSAHSPIL